MAGTRLGGIKAAQSNKQRYGDEFYKIIGGAGGRAGNTGGFASNPELASIAGAKGGRKSKRPGIEIGGMCNQKRHQMTRDNIRTNPAGSKYCKDCQLEAQARFRLKKKKQESEA